LSTVKTTTCDYCPPTNPKRKTGANNWWTICERTEFISIRPYDDQPEHSKEKDACGRACVNTAIAGFMDKIEARRNPEAHLKEVK